MKRPAFQFYPADWRKDAALQSCSLAARGLWVETMCIVHECEPYGHLVVNGKGMPASRLARLVGLTERECARLLAELEDAGVFSRDPNGVIFSRRMVKDERVRNARSAGGQDGAKFGELGKEHGVKGGRPRNERGVSKPPSEPPPSSSSSSSSTPIHTTELVERERAASPPTTRRKARLPDGWVLPKPWGEWAQAERGWPADEVRRVADLFADHWRGKGEARADWEATWRNWVRREASAKPRADARTDARNAFAASILGDIGHDQQAADHSDPRDISGEAVRVA